MGVFSEYLGKSLDFSALEKERKKQLKRISDLRGGRGVLTIAAAMTKDAPIGIDYDDRVALADQLSAISGSDLDIILETPGGYAEIVEDLVLQIRARFSSVGMIVPGYAKSAGTIMVMAGDEILMGVSSSLGPIDAQIIQGNKRFSAHAFLEGLTRIKREVDETGALNRAYVPILQNISPGEIQNCENALAFARTLVTNWLCKYKFSTWDTHSSTGQAVSDDEKRTRAKEIADALCDHGRWLTHGRTITLGNLRDMGLKVTDYGENSELADAIQRYYVLLKMTFDQTNIFKLFETPTSQVTRFAVPAGIPALPPQKNEPDGATIEIECPNCKNKTEIQARFTERALRKPGVVQFPKDNKFTCPSCNATIDLSGMRHQLESQTKKTIV